MQQIAGNFTYKRQAQHFLIVFSFSGSKAKQQKPILGIAKPRPRLGPSPSSSPSPIPQCQGPAPCLFVSKLQHLYINGNEAAPKRDFPFTHTHAVSSIKVKKKILSFSLLKVNRTYGYGYKVSAQGTKNNQALVEHKLKSWAWNAQ